jgi:hypothetical protein
MTQEQLRMQMLAGIITEGQFKAKLNEELSDDVKQYLKDNFEMYLEGGDEFEEEPGETHTFTMEADEFGNPEYYDDADTFKKAIEQLKSSSFILDSDKEEDFVGEGYGKITFTTDGTNIKLSFTVPKYDNKNDNKNDGKNKWSKSFENHIQALKDELGDEYEDAKINSSLEGDGNKPTISSKIDGNPVKVFKTIHDEDGNIEDQKLYNY